MILTRDYEEWDCVVGIDPGETTGLFALRLGAGGRLADRVRAGGWFAGQIEVSRAISPYLFLQECATQKQIAGRLASLAEAWGLPCVHLAFEDFTLRERTMERSLLSPVRMTSGILAYLHEMNDVNFVCHFESAADAKSVVQDAMLQKVNIYSPGKPHANDAARHAILTLRKNDK
jgi:hypothetical protein